MDTVPGSRFRPSLSALIRCPIVAQYPVRIHHACRSIRKNLPVAEKYVDIEGNEWTIASSAEGWLWVKEFITTGATKHSFRRFEHPEECLQDARSQGLLEGYRLGGECVRRHNGSWRWRVIGLHGRVDEESVGIYSTEDACLANARANAVGWEAPIVDQPVQPADEQLRSLDPPLGDAACPPSPGRKDVRELVAHVGRIVTETGRPVPQIDGHSGSSVSQEQGFATSVMTDALDTGLIVACPDEVLSFFGGKSALCTVDLTESGWALYEEYSSVHRAPEPVEGSQVDADSLESSTTSDPRSGPGIQIHANAVNIGTAVGGHVTGDVHRSQDSSNSSSEPFLKRHRRKAVWVAVAALLTALLAIPAEEFLKRVGNDLYDHFFSDPAADDAER